jgi:hypothetical protein
MVDIKFRGYQKPLMYDKCNKIANHVQTSLCGKFNPYGFIPPTITLQPPSVELLPELLVGLHP